jgi:hypothetical protein
MRSAAAVDKRYYFRNNMKKEPADHWIIEDIRNRVTRRAKLEVCKDEAQLQDSSFWANLKIRNSGLRSAAEYHWELLVPLAFVSAARPP